VSSELDPDPHRPRGDDDVDPFEELVLDALESMPAVFSDQLGSVAVVIEEEPTPRQLAESEAQGLLGLYTGVPRTTYRAGDAPVPSKITIFRGPHLRQFRTPAALALGVAATVRHEVAHHLGISDARLEELARERRPVERGRAAPDT
jgi:predicted Zn-dependent protease with MMP-like domain